MNRPNNDTTVSKGSPDRRDEEECGGAASVYGLGCDTGYVKFVFGSEWGWEYEERTGVSSTLDGDWRRAVVEVSSSVASNAVSRSASMENRRCGDGSGGGINADGNRGR